MKKLTEKEMIKNKVVDKKYYDEMWQKYDRCNIENKTFREIIATQGKDMDKVVLRLDSCLYAMVLMQDIIKEQRIKIEKLEKNTLSLAT